MNINPQIILTLYHQEYANLVLLIDYAINEDAVMTPEMYAFAIQSAIKFGLTVKDSEDEPEETEEPKLH